MPPTPRHRLGELRALRLGRAGRAHRAGARETVDPHPLVEGRTVTGGARGPID